MPPAKKAAGKVLARNVTVADELGNGTTYLAGTSVSDEVAAQITNPKAFEPEVDHAIVSGVGDSEAKH